MTDHLWHSRQAAIYLPEEGPVLSCNSKNSSYCWALDTIMHSSPVFCPSPLSMPFGSLAKVQGQWTKQ